MSVIAWTSSVSLSFERKFGNMADLINSDVFLAFSTYTTIVILKMMLMAPLTGYFRITKKVELVLKIHFDINCNKEM